MILTIWRGSSIRPFAMYPHAKKPSPGSIKWYSSSFNTEILCCVRLFSYIWTFIAGAINLGVSVASSVDVTISSAIPTLNLAIVLAVAGATTIQSAQSPNAICWMSSGFSSINVLVYTGFLLMAWKAKGVTNSCAWSVSITLTS